MNLGSRLRLPLVINSASGRLVCLLRVWLRNGSRCNFLLPIDSQDWLAACAFPTRRA